MPKTIDAWKVIFGGAAVPTAYAFLKKAIPIGQCAAVQCLGATDRWPTVIAGLLAIAMVGIALWMRGNAARRVADRAALEAKSAREDALTIVTAFEIKVRGDRVQLGPAAAHLSVQDTQVEAAVRRIRDTAK